MKKWISMQRSDVTPMMPIPRRIGFVFVFLVIYIFWGVGSFKLQSSSNESCDGCDTLEVENTKHKVRSNAEANSKNLDAQKLTGFNQYEERLGWLKHSRFDALKKNMNDENDIGSDKGEPVVEGRDKSRVYNDVNDSDFLKEEQDTKSNVIKVCAVATNPRQGSIFRTNLLSILGSGRFIYEIPQGGQQCPIDVPRVRMVPYVKCCMDLRTVEQSIIRLAKKFDIIIVTGDEYCAVSPMAGAYQYRQYWGDNVIGKGGHPVSPQLDGNLLPQNVPMYFPLGPRAEFKRVNQVSEVKPVMERKWQLNFAGSPTSISRRVLRDFFKSPTWTESKASKVSFIQFTDKWQERINVNKGYLGADEYRDLLLDSAFTLCPTGHNPEAFRIYEACEAGSIPIVTVGDADYMDHKCANAFTPFIQAGAPFVYLQSWDELGPFMEMVANNRTFLEQKQRHVRQWYKQYMHKAALDFERHVEQRFKQRMERLGRHARSR